MSKYKYCPPEQAKLFDFEVHRFIGFLEKAASITSYYKQFAQTFYAQGVNFSDIIDMVHNRLPRPIHDFIMACEDETDRQPISDKARRQLYFNVHFLHEIAEQKKKYINHFVEGFIKTALTWIPPQALQVIEQNLNRVGLTLHDVIPLIKGTGSAKAYSDLSFLICMHLEKSFLEMFEFLLQETGVENEIKIFRGVSAQDGVTPIVMVQTIAGPWEAKPIHFPMLPYEIADILQRARERKKQTAQQPTQAPPETLVLPISPKQLAAHDAAAGNEEN